MLGVLCVLVTFSAMLNATEQTTILPFQFKTNAGSKLESYQYECARKELALVMQSITKNEPLATHREFYNTLVFPVEYCVLRAAQGDDLGEESYKHLANFAYDYPREAQSVFEKYQAYKMQVLDTLYLQRPELFSNFASHGIVYYLMQKRYQCLSSFLKKIPSEFFNKHMTYALFRLYLVHVCICKNSSLFNELAIRVLSYETSHTYVIVPSNQNELDPFFGYAKYLIDECRDKIVHGFVTSIENVQKNIPQALQTNQINTFSCIIS